MSQPGLVQCDFCGLEFDPACTEAGCQGCPLARGCSKITCPRCGYTILPEAKLIGWMRRIAQKTALSAQTRRPDEASVHKTAR